MQSRKKARQRIVSEHAFAIPLFLFAIAALAASVPLIMMNHRHLLDQNRAARQTETRALLANWVKVGMSCAKTMTLNPGACGTDPIPIGRVGASAAPLIVGAADGGFPTTIGGFPLKSTCTGTSPKVFTVSVQTPTRGWTDLFPTQVLQCP